MKIASRQSDLSGTSRVFACQSDDLKQPVTPSSIQSKRNDLDTLLELGAFHCPLDLITTDVKNHGTNTIRALADMFTCRLTNFPVTTGIFTTQNDKEYLSRLASELRNISRLSGPVALRFSVLLFLFPLFVSTFLGYLVGMLTTWQVGLSIGHVGMFLQITFLVIIITGSRVCHNHIATRISHSVAQFLRWLQLILNVCFCYPTQQIDTKAPVKTIVVYHRLWPSTTPNVALFSMVDKMWTGLIRMHGEISIRLQRASKPSPLPNRRFKRVCCLPAFLVVLAFCVSFMTETGMIRYYSGEFTAMLTEKGTIVIFVISSSILFLGLFGSIPSLYRLIRSLTINPVQPLRTALADFLSDEANEEEYSHLRPQGKHTCLPRRAAQPSEPVVLGNSTSLKNMAITAEEERARRADILIKEVFTQLCKLSITFDRFLSDQQTRFIICLDASETKQCDVLAKLIYQIHSLVLTESTAPVAFVLEANFKVLLGDTVASAICPPYLVKPNNGVPEEAPRTLSDNLHLINSSIHLPIYLEAPLFTDVESEPHSKDLTPNSVNVSPNGFPHPGPAQSAKRTSGIMYTPRSIFGNRGSVAPFRGGPEKSSTQLLTGQLSHSNSTLSRSVETCQGIAGLFLRDHELADWNGKMMKQLISATSFTSRFLRLCNLEVPIEEMILWITLVEYWPYHIAWLVVYLEGLIEGKSYGTGKPISNQTGINLIDCFQEVKARVAASIDQLEPLVEDDRDLERLEGYLRAKASRPISIGNLKKLISCVLIHNPFLRHCIRAQILNPDRRSASEDRRGGHLGPFSPALTTLVEGQVDSFRKTNQNIGSSGPYVMNRSNSGKGRLSIPLGSTDAQGVHFFPCNADLLTSAEQTPRISYEGRTKEIDQHLLLSQYTVSDVCNLIDNIREIDPEHRYIYQTNVRDHNVNGLVICRTDSERLKHEIGMNQSDWQAFCRSVQYLHGQESRLHEGLRNMRMTAEVESDSESIVNPLVIANKYPFFGSFTTPGERQQQQPMFLSTPLQPTQHGMSAQTRLIRSSPSSSLASSNHLGLKNPTLIRQTPWLLSPQVPTSLTNSDGADLLVNDAFSPLVHNAEHAENQASLSGMEEPESLYKTTTQPVVSKSLTKPRGISEYQGMEKSSSQKSFHEQIELETRKDIFASSPANIEARMTTTRQSRRPSNMEHENSTMRYRDASLVDEGTQHGLRPSRSRRPDSRRYNSRSTVDLRTAFGPLSYNPQAAEMCYREVLHRKPKCRAKSTHMRHTVATGDPRIIPNKAVRDEEEMYLFNAIAQEQQQMHPEIAFSAIPMSLRSPWKASTQQPDEEMKDIRRMKKRPCRRSSKVQAPYDVFVNKNAQEAALVPTQLSGHVSKIAGGHPESAVIDSESDSVAYNPQSVAQFPGVLPWSVTNGPRRERRSRKLLHSPALNPAQLASLYSYVTHAGKLPLLSNPPFEFPYGKNFVESEAATKMDYFHFPHMNYASLYTEPAESYKPSQKKRARHSEHITTATTSPRLVHSALKSRRSNELVHLDYLDEGTNSPDSEAEECTCEYWYGIDRNGGKVTISEPTLRGDSDDLCSDDNVQSHSLDHEIPKKNIYDKMNGHYGAANDCG
ncbi:hypothetical protein FGIG_03514 [Fasciola gigantica]|uniref:Kinase D-interacting substrate of 220 kDa-like SAM domain-containing protein n=1 Tax=Fasciola gigantica TaxID=46835 RepID=A0A504YHK8_FASGI|nr:hypothetical protein FGIG_03514 [Fasciola gigantica]